ncbi:lamin tail domain-containing protein [Streptomyces massasporeus]
MGPVCDGGPAGHQSQYGPALFALPLLEAGDAYEGDRVAASHRCRCNSLWRNRSLNLEWVEITNTGRRAMNLDGWTLRDEDGHTFTFHHYRLDGRSTVRIPTGEGHDTRTDLFQDRRNYVWDNRSNTATLRNDHGRFIDDESWGHHRHGGPPPPLTSTAVTRNR